MMEKNTDRPRPESISFFENAIQDHDNVFSCKKLQDQVYIITRRNGDSLKVYITDLYTVGLADYYAIKGLIPNLDAIVTLSNWNGYTYQAKIEAKKHNIGIFVMREFYGALNNERITSYIKYDSKRKPIHFWRDSDYS